MRHKLLTTLFLVLMVTVAGFVAAQEPAAEEPPAQGENPEAMAQDAQGAAAPAPEAETRSLKADETMVVTGTAVNASPDEIIVKTEDGREVFLIDSEDIHPEPIAEGTPVTVWFVERGGHQYATKLEADSGYSTLPQTAGLQPLFALVGLIALAGSAALWRLQV